MKSIVIGYEFWQRAFGGDKQIVGKTVRISRWDVAGRDRSDGAGSALPAFAGCGEGAELYVNATVDLWVPADPGPEVSEGPGWNVVGRLRDGVTPQPGQQELAALPRERRARRSEFEGFAPQLEPLTDEMNRDGRRFSCRCWARRRSCCSSPAGTPQPCCLCAGLQRQQEYAVRDRHRHGPMGLSRQVLTEGLLLASLGGRLELLWLSAR